MRVGSMSDGTICTVQGAVSQLGDLGSTVWSLAIALHTFWSVSVYTFGGFWFSDTIVQRLLFLTRKPHYLVAPVALCTAWAILIILPIVGPLVIQNQNRGSFYDISGAWCWIGTSYGTARVLYLYVSLHCILEV